jgi:methionyl-tRNA synthetase
LTSVASSSCLVVTTTPPTPNGDLHVGHISGPYLGADILVRYARLRGRRAFHVSSSDENQTYVVTTAEREGVEPHALALRCGEDIVRTLEAASIGIDVFNRPDARHERCVSEFFHMLHRAGKLVAKEVDVFFDPSRGRYLVESYIGGRCPVCLQGTKGSICEACGHPNDPFKLIDPYVVGAPEIPLETRRIAQLFLPVERYRDRIASFYGERRARWRRHLPRLVDELLSEPLADYPVSYVSDWGIPVGLPGFEGQVWNVWAEMLPGLVNSTALAAEAAGAPPPEADWWDERAGATLVQFLGFDNSYFFGVTHLAMLFAADDCGERRWLKPSYIVTNEFFQLENRKFSTSLGHAIWGRELLERHSADAVRFYLALVNPETFKTNFVEREMVERVESELLEPWRRLTRSLERAASSDGRHRSPLEGDTPELAAIAWRLESFYELETFSPVEAAETIVTWIKFLAERAEAGALAEVWQGLAALAVFALPLMPDFATRLAAAVGLELPLRWGSWRPSAPPEPVPAEILTLARPEAKPADVAAPAMSPV